jgi:tetratricopeptide (TPR) repeat protein
MRAVLRVAVVLCAAGVFMLAGCARLAQSWYLNGCDRDIEEGTQAVEAARDDAQRATAYTQRGRAYSEKGRYSQMFKLVSAEESGRLFSLSVNDHDKAVGFSPGSAEVYFGRGRTYYDRATVDKTDAKTWYELAGADFKKAAEKDRGHYMALDMLGLVLMDTGQLDDAVQVFTREMAINQLGKARLVDVYCQRGSSNYGAKKYDAAIADYEKSIEMNGSYDDCACDPHDPLISLYDRAGQYDKAWETVHKAEKAKKWIDPDMLARLKKNSQRER